MTSNANAAQVNPDTAPRLSFIDLTQSGRPAERQWLIRDRIPLRQPTLFSGKGGGGKSITALQLCAASALDQDWLGMPASPGDAIYLGAEDEADELHRRIAAIADHYQVSVSDLAQRLHVASLAGRDALLTEHNRSGTKATPLFDELYEMGCDLKPKVIVLDTASDMFGGDENDRAHVTAFTGLLRKLAMDANAAVIITSHPSQYGLSTGSGFSGSTAWHGKVRSQLYLKQDRGSDRELHFLKNNYGPVGASLTLVWRDGVFIPKPAGNAGEESEREAEAEGTFLRVLARYTLQNRNVTDKPGTTYAPSLFTDEPEAAGYDKTELNSAMRRLLTQGKIALKIEGPKSRQRSKLIIVEGAK